MQKAGAQYVEVVLQLEMASAHAEAGEKKKAVRVRDLVNKANRTPNAGELQNMTVRMLDLVSKANPLYGFEKRTIALYASSCEFEKTYQELRKFLKKHPRDKFIIKELRYIGYKYQKAGRHQSALNLFDKLVHARPSDEHLLNDRGIVYALMGKDEQAINDLRMGIEINPRFLPAYLTLGGIYASKGKIQQAYEIYDKALRQKGVSKGEILRLIKQEHDKLKRNLSQQSPR